ncbi:MAG: hypothetical protein IT189_10880 [Microbacteriaceae bacterium]|nr:hypothetical protein [Microbacteriaceae bacterium]
MIDRRTFLQGGLSAAVIAALAERGAFAAQPGAAFGPAAVRALDPAPPGSRTPYSLTTSSVLSEDYFMTASVPIDPTADSVGPFVNLNGDVEALVVSGGILSHLARDSTQPSGWSFGAVPGMPGNTLPDGSMVAARTHPAGGGPEQVRRARGHLRRARLRPDDDVPRDPRPPVG